MRLKTPAYWYKRYSAEAFALLLPSYLYGTGRLIHQAVIKPYKAAIPVICIGNLVAGGSGKTPTALAVSKLVKNNRLADNPCFLSRGYGRKTKGHFLVNLDHHTTEDVGDEPVLLADRMDTIIAADRRKGARYAEANDYDLIIMDDGLQNPGLFKDICLTVIDGATGFGNRQLLPAGPLREPLSAGFKRTHAFIMLGEDKTGLRSLLPPDKPVFDARLQVPKSWIADTKVPYVAFCGLGRPDKFYETLKDIGLNIASWTPYPDHFQYQASDLRDLAEKARMKEARLITTAKDAARIPAELLRELPLDILPVEIVWHDKEAVTAFLQDKLGQIQKR